MFFFFRYDAPAHGALLDALCAFAADSPADRARVLDRVVAAVDGPEERAWQLAQLFGTTSAAARRDGRTVSAVQATTRAAAAAPARPALVGSFPVAAAAGRGAPTETSASTYPGLLENQAAEADNGGTAEAKGGGGGEGGDAATAVLVVAAALGPPADAPLPLLAPRGAVCDGSPAHLARSPDALADEVLRALPNARRRAALVRCAERSLGRCAMARRDIIVVDILPPSSGLFYASDC